MLGPPNVEARIGVIGGNIFQGDCLPTDVGAPLRPVDGHAGALPGAVPATHPAGSVIGRTAATPRTRCSWTRRRDQPSRSGVGKGRPCRRAFARAQVRLEPDVAVADRDRPAAERVPSGADHHRAVGDPEPAAVAEAVDVPGGSAGPCSPCGGTCCRRRRTRRARLRDDSPRARKDRGAPTGPRRSGHRLLLLVAARHGEKRTRTSPDGNREDVQRTESDRPREALDMPKLHVPAHPVGPRRLPASSTGTTPRSTSCGVILQRQARRWCTSARTARSTRWSPRRRRKMSRAWVSVGTRWPRGDFTDLVELLRERGAGHVKVYGGRRLIVPREIELLGTAAAWHVSSPRTTAPAARAARDGQEHDPRVRRRPRGDRAPARPRPAQRRPRGAGPRDHSRRNGPAARGRRSLPRGAGSGAGITGTGGTGKSSEPTELIRRLRLDQQDKLRIAGRRGPDAPSGRGRAAGRPVSGSTCCRGDRTFFRSMAIAVHGGGLPERLGDAIVVLKGRSVDLVIVETPVSAEGDAAIAPVPRPLALRHDTRVRAASQPRRSTCRTSPMWWRSTNSSAAAPRTPAATWPAGAAAQPRKTSRVLAGHARLRHQRGHIQRRWRDRARPRPRDLLARDGLPVAEGRLPRTERRTSSEHAAIVPPQRTRYLSEIADPVRGHHAATDRMIEAARRRQHLRTAQRSPSASRCRRRWSRPSRHCPPRPARCSTHGRRRRTRTPATRWWCRSATANCARSSPARRSRATGSAWCRCRGSPTTASS